MFERFTEKAINVVSRSQEIARGFDAKCVEPKHLLFALVGEAKGISLKIFKSNNISYGNLVGDECGEIPADAQSLLPLPFETGTKEILKKALDLANKSSNPTILYEHLFLALISYKNIKNAPVKILEKEGFDVYGAKNILEKLVQKKIKRLSHPETDEATETTTSATDAVFESAQSAEIFERAAAKLSASGYEIMGTEQIIASILEDKSSELSQILAECGVTDALFEEKLAQIKSRQAEYAERQIIFTPNAFAAMNAAFQAAKELGSSAVLPEHIVLGMLKTKRGLAYDIFKKLQVSDDDLAHGIIKPIEKQMPETLTILRLAKEEARRLGRNIVGTEMFLLGVIGEASGVGAAVLNELEINIKDARAVVETLIGFGDEYSVKEITFTKRAKRVLEAAWKFAKQENKSKIESSHMLLALTTEPNSLAMKALAQLGVDAVEIKEGIKKAVRGIDA